MTLYGLFVQFIMFSDKAAAGTVNAQQVIGREAETATLLSVSFSPDVAWCRFDHVNAVVRTLSS
jgi:hypothetical protein